MSVNVDTIIQRITDTIKTETVVGEQITIGEVTLIPIINVSFGFGAGGGEGKQGNSDQGAGTGGGGGARMTVAGVVVVKGSEVSFMPTGKNSGKPCTIDRILDALPGLLEKVSVKTSKSTKEAPEQDAAGDQG